MPVDNNRAAEITQGQPTNEVPVKKKAKKKPGPQPLVPGEETECLYTHVPESLRARVQKRIRRGQSISEYLRKLIEDDLRKAG